MGLAGNKADPKGIERRVASVLWALCLSRSLRFHGDATFWSVTGKEVLGLESLPSKKTKITIES